MSAHAEHGPSHGADHGPEAHGSHGESYPKNFGMHAINAVREGVWGPIAQVLKGVVDLSSDEPWKHSLLAPVGKVAINTVARPVTAVKELFYSGGKWGLNPGKALFEVGRIVTVPVNQTVNLARRIVEIPLTAAERMSRGFSELVEAPSMQSVGYEGRTTFGGSGPWQLPSIEPSVAGFHAHDHAPAHH